MQGRRIYPSRSGLLELNEPGDYGFRPSVGHWYARTPNGYMANLAAHTVTVHEDETITVHPSIGVRTDSNGAWAYHGWLERGVWREA